MRTDCAIVDPTREKHLGENTDFSMPASSQDSQNASQNVSSWEQQNVPVEQFEHGASRVVAEKSSSSSTRLPLETDGGFVVGTESFANMNEISITPQSQGGVSSRSYPNTATANEGEISIDLCLTLLDTFDQNGNLTTGTAAQLPVTFSDFEQTPILLARKTGSSVSGYQGHTANIKVEFFDNKTGEPFSVVGEFTFRGIDFIAPQSTEGGAGEEAVTVVSGQVQSCQVSTDPATDIITQANNGTIRFTNGSTCGGNDDQQRWVGIKFLERTFLNLRFQARNANTGYGLSTVNFSEAASSFLPLQAQGHAAANDWETTTCDSTVEVVVVAANEDVDGLTVSTSDQGTVGAARNGSCGEIIISSDGTYCYTLDSSFPEAVLLQAGQTLAETFDSKVANPASVSQDVSLATDQDSTPPVVVIAIPDQTHLDSDVISADVSSNFSAPVVGKPLFFSAVGLPDGLSIDPAGEIIGTIGSCALRAGPYSVIITAETEDGVAVSDTFSWNVLNLAENLADSTAQGGGLEKNNNSPVVNTNIPDQTNLDGDNIDADISPNFTCHDSSGLKFSATGLPQGLSIDSSGRISGTIGSNASQNGSFAVVIRAENGNGETVSDTFTWTVGRHVPIADFERQAADTGVAIVGSFGTTRINANGSYTYAIDLNNPAVGGLDANQTLTETFQCAVDDGQGEASQAELRIDISGTDLRGLENDSWKFALITRAPAYGTVVANADRSVTYTRSRNFNGTDSFEYEVCDRVRNCDIIAVTVGVTPVGDASLKFAADGKIGQDYTVTGSGQGGCEIKEERVGLTEINGVAVVSGQTITLPSGGAVTLNANGNVSYNANGEFEDLSKHAAIDTSSYTISDSSGRTSIAETVIMINGENDISVAQDDFVTTTLNTPVTLDVTGNFIAGQTDGSELLNVVLLNQPADGTAVVAPDGTIVFMPSSDFQGTATIHYLIEDANGSSTDATVTIDVEPQIQFDPNAEFSPSNSAGNVASLG